MFSHERIIIRRGPESGLPIIVAVHSTALGQALGGCRLKPYADWRDGLADALRLSAAMTDKCALAGLPNGGGKTVIVGEHSPAALRDAGAVIEELGGTYATGPDIGTGPDDMVTIGERTSHVFCRPVAAGGSGDSSPGTAVGTVAALRAVCSDRFGSSSLAGRSFSVLGLGRVGGRVARLLAEAGSKLVVADVDPAKRALADDLGAGWVTPEEALTAAVDVVVPAALGGVLTPSSVAALRCAAVAGPANNQLDARATAGLLHERGILWAPDYVVSAGGVIAATAVELRHESPAQVTARLDGIADTLAGVFAAARRDGVTPSAAAAAEARRRVASPRG
ncbi:Glu/Leu/Phe/Val dehydrogenase dimerization domain-containing protein [Paractinoplanes lichenicola]|uniref:Amino acid dehydrogenase n=1 Tax=Paractinoplanes lichenicola TaxID=2802976 RepID=A0ABS1VNU4_9ACTN|nr:Glu/Leu/Phe/Val dehydrogenase dimerization domain-containing protein [Actinoplanes lichenicola]MBL7256406.1 amino acid dehydrogenase [Actinoplanes lichenicola]